MEIARTITLHSAVSNEDMPRIDKHWRQKIRNAIRAKLIIMPEVYGLPLRQNLRGFWKLRVGDYRVIYQIQKQTVRILIISHRSEVYKNILKRIV